MPVLIQVDKFDKDKSHQYLITKTLTVTFIRKVKLILRYGPLNNNLEVLPILFTFLKIFEWHKEHKHTGCLCSSFLSSLSVSELSFNLIPLPTSSLLTSCWISSEKSFLSSKSFFLALCHPFLYSFLPPLHLVLCLPQLLFTFFFLICTFHFHSIWQIFLFVLV